MRVRPTGGWSVADRPCERFVAGGPTRDTGAARSAAGSPGAPLCGHVALVHRSGVAARLRRLVGR